METPRSVRLNWRLDAQSNRRSVYEEICRRRNRGRIHCGSIHGLRPNGRWDEESTEIDAMAMSHSGEPPISFCDLQALCKLQKISDFTLVGLIP